MAALIGELISSLYDANGQLAIRVVVFWDQNSPTLALRDADYVTVQDGTKHGAVIGDNPTTKPVSMVITNETTGQQKTLNIPAHGVALTTTQLASQGITTLADVNGFSFNVG